jgi:hypothetical protein
MVRCADCGLLGYRVPSTRELIEVDEKCRAAGALCAAGVAAFADDWDQTKSGIRVITKDRDCACFVKWRRGLSPGWHHQMIANEELRAWQTAEKEKERAWQEHMEAERDKREAEREERYRQADHARLITLGVLSALATILGGAIGAIATLVAGFLTR